MVRSYGGVFPVEAPSLQMTLLVSSWHKLVHSFLAISILLSVSVASMMTIQMVVISADQQQCIHLVLLIFPVPSIVSVHRSKSINTCWMNKWLHKWNILCLYILGKQFHRPKYINPRPLSWWSLLSTWHYLESSEMRGLQLWNYLDQISLWPCLWETDSWWLPGEGPSQCG